MVDCYKTGQLVQKLDKLYGAFRDMGFDTPWLNDVQILALQIDQEAIKTASDMLQGKLVEMNGNMKIINCTDPRWHENETENDRIYNGS